MQPMHIMFLNGRPNIVLIFIKQDGITHKIHNKLSLFVNQIAYVIHFIKDQYGSTLSNTPVMTCCESAENATSHTHRWLASCSSVIREKSEVFQIFAVWSAELVTIMLGGLGIQGGRNTLEAIIRNFCLVELIPWWLE